MPPSTTPRRAGAAAAPAPSHRFQDRRQERMRGAGNQPILQRNFAFSAKPRQGQPPTAAAAATPAAAAATSARSPRRSTAAMPAPRSAMKGARAAEAAAAARSDPSSSSSTAAARRMSRVLASTPGRRRVGGDARRGASSSRGRASTSRALVRDEASESEGAEDDDDVGGEQGESEEAELGEDDEVGRDAPPRLRRDPTGYLVDDIAADDVGVDDVLGDMDMPDWAEPADDSRSARDDDDDAARIDLTPRSLVGSVAAAKGKGKLGEGASMAAASPASVAAQRKMEARRARRQEEPNDGRPRLVQRRLPGASEPAPPRGSTARRGGSGRTAARPPSTTTARRSDVSATRAVGAASEAQRRATERRLRLKKVVALALGTTGRVKGRRSYGRINDADVVWSVVGEELREASQSQALSRVARALKSVRKAVRSGFERLSLQWARRAELVEQLREARRRKRELRHAVWRTRAEVLEVQRAVSALEARKEQEEEHDQREKQMAGFLQELRDLSQLWT